MKQIENKFICKYCLGCVAEETEEFKPKMSCKDFAPAYDNWQERYYKELKKIGSLKYWEDRKEKQDQGLREWENM